MDPQRKLCKQNTGQNLRRTRNFVNVRINTSPSGRYGTKAIPPEGSGTVEPVLCGSIGTNLRIVDEEAHTTRTHVEVDPEPVQFVIFGSEQLQRQHDGGRVLVLVGSKFCFWAR